jgi:hypothetical protein
MGLIRRVLDELPSHSAPTARFRNELEDYMSEDYERPSRPSYHGDATRNCSRMTSRRSYSASKTRTRFCHDRLEERCRA